MPGCADGTARFSLRSGTAATAGALADHAAGADGTGGGHRSLAAGQVPLTSCSKTAHNRAAREIRDRFLDALNRADVAPRKLVP